MASILSAEMLHGMDIKSYPAGTKIFVKGDAAENAFLLVKGDVALIATTAEGKNVALARVAPGQIFGELAILNDSARAHHAVAVTESSCAIIARDLMESRLGKIDPFMRYWIEFMSQRLTDLSQRTETHKPPAETKPEDGS